MIFFNKNFKYILITFILAHIYFFVNIFFKKLVSTLFYIYNQSEIIYLKGVLSTLNVCLNLQKMEKNKFNFFQKYAKIIFPLMIFAIGFLIIFINTLEISDELWLFHHTYKISQGCTIYSDVNVIITPIFFYIGKLFLLVFGKNMIIFRIYGLLIFVILYFITYKVMKSLKFSKHIAFLSTVLLFLLTMSIVTAGANYNALVMVFVLIGVDLYIKRNDNFFLHGLIMFLVFFTKQNIGVYYIIAMIICDLYLYGFSRKFFIGLIKKFAIFALFSVIILLQMFFTGNLLDFINFAFGGLFEFRKQNVGFAASPYYLIIYITTFLLYFFVLFTKKTFLAEIINEDNFKNLSILMIFTTFISLIIYPIFNSAHFLFAMPLHFIIIMYIFNIFIFDEFYGAEKYAGVCNFMAFMVLLLVFARIGSYYFEQSSKTDYILDSNSPFFGIPTYTEYLEKSEIIEEYILKQNKDGIDVIIISDDCSLPIIELNQNHHIYDLLYEGNLGYDGKNRIKSDIISRRNTQFLVVTNEEDIFEQQPPEIREFIMENLTYKGTVCNYSIYETN